MLENLITQVDKCYRVIPERGTRTFEQETLRMKHSRQNFKNTTIQTLYTTIL